MNDMTMKQGYTITPASLGWLLRCWADIGHGPIWGRPIWFATRDAAEVAGKRRT
jgi:hypothetical protein